MNLSFAGELPRLRHATHSRFKGRECSHRQALRHVSGRRFALQQFNYTSSSTLITTMGNEQAAALGKGNGGHQPRDDLRPEFERTQAAREHLRIRALKLGDGAQHASRSPSRRLSGSGIRGGVE